MKISMRAARTNKNLSLEDMSFKMGVSKSTIHRWEKGIQSVPDEAFLKYCEVCEISPNNVIQTTKRKGVK